MSEANAHGAQRVALSRALLGWLTHPLTHDRARDPRRTTPNPAGILVGATFLSLLIIWLYRYAPRFGVHAEWMFAKEGVFEQVTFVAELAAAIFLAIAARRSWGQGRTLAALYAAGALILFVGGMEEIGWGQQLLHFSTPERWAAMNHQQETTLHNLLSGDSLSSSARWIAYAFAPVAVAFSVVGTMTERPLLVAIAPHPSLVPSAVAIAFAGWKTHAEVVEVLMALYALFYSYRAFALTVPVKDDSRPARTIPAAGAAGAAGNASSPMPQKILITGALSNPSQLGDATNEITVPDVPLARGAAGGWQYSDILEYTHDAIIIWEMDGAGILYWNRAAELLYEYSREEAIGKVTHTLLRTRLAGGVDGMEATLSRYGVWAGELRHISRLGKEIVVQARLALMSQQNGRWLVLEVNRDLSSAPRSDAQQAIESHLSALTPRDGVQHHDGRNLP